MYLNYVHIVFRVMLVVLYSHSVDCMQSKCVLCDNQDSVCATSLSEAMGTFPKAGKLQTQWLTEVGLYHIL